MCVCVCVKLCVCEYKFLYIYIFSTTQILPGLQGQACGSYRRLMPTSGDIDVIFTHPVESKLRGFVAKLVHRLTKMGFLTDDLSNKAEDDEDAHGSYMGVCKLTREMIQTSRDGLLKSTSPTKRPTLRFPSVPSSKELPTLGKHHRRIDIKVYPAHEFCWAILYFTGSDHFNRSMRYFAKKQGWTMSDKGLAHAYRVKGEKVAVGENVGHCKSEEDIFRLLELTYVPPEKRSVYENWVAVDRNFQEADGFDDADTAQTPHAIAKRREEVDGVTSLGKQHGEDQSSVNGGGGVPSLVGGWAVDGYMEEGYQTP